MFYVHPSSCCIFFHPYAHMLQTYPPTSILFNMSLSPRRTHLRTAVSHFSFDCTATALPMLQPLTSSTPFVTQLHQPMKLFPTVATSPPVLQFTPLSSSPPYIHSSPLLRLKGTCSLTFLVNKLRLSNGFNMRTEWNFAFGFYVLQGLGRIKRNGKFWMEALIFLFQKKMKLSSRIYIWVNQRIGTKSVNRMDSIGSTKLGIRVGNVFQ